MTDHTPNHEATVRRVDDNDYRPEPSPTHYAEQAEVRPARSQAPRSPQDHRPKRRDPIVIEFMDEVFTIDGRGPSDVRTMFALRYNDFETVLVKLIGQEALDRLIDKMTDEDGYADFDELSDFVSAIYEKAGSKNS